jgi:hypothetical protein
VSGAPKDESCPIEDDEWLYRRIFIDHVEPQPVSHRAFEPRVSGRDPDTTGISLYRADCLTDPSSLLEQIPEDKRHLRGIVRIKVSDVRRLGLTIVPEKDQTPGHVVIPELNSIVHAHDKNELIGKMSDLARFASVPGGIVIRPKR